MANITGSDNGETLTGTNSADSISGLGGSDVIYGGSGNDSLYGGSGADSLYGDNGADRLYGEDGDDLLDGGAGNDSLYGGNGNDTLIGGAGADTLDGGAGIDTVDYSSTNTAVNVNLVTGQGGGSSSSHSYNDRYTSIENVIGGGGNDTITGDGGANALYGGGGNDTIHGGAGDDTLEGGAGNDVLNGDAGNDTATWANSGAGVNANLLTGTATGAASGSDVLSGIENLTGSAYSDALVGDDQANAIRGGSGNDTIHGGGGDDVIVAGPEAVSTLGMDLNWTLAGANGQSVASGVTQNTGGVNVGVSFTNDGNATDFSISTAAGYVGAGEPFNPGSHLYLGGTGAGNTSTTTVNFSAATGSGMRDMVENVRFRINDIDQSTPHWQDIITVTAYDADGNEVPVTFTMSGNDTASGNTITAGATSDPASSALGSALVTVAGPVARIVIDYDNTYSSGQLILISDIHFDARPNDDDLVHGGAGNDSISGGGGNDTLHGDAGNDTLDGGAGDDRLHGGDGDDRLLGGTGNDLMEGGAGSDVFVLEAGFGNDTVIGGESPDDWDVLDASGLAVNLTVTQTGAEAGTLTGTGGHVQFAEVERGQLGAGNDTVHADSDLGPISFGGGAGNDTLNISGTGIGRDAVDVGDSASGTFTPQGGGGPIAFGPGQGRLLSDILAEYRHGQFQFSGSGLSGQVGQIGFDGFETVNFDIICFLRGTRLETDRGAVRVEALRPGDRLWTRDHGYQPLRWTGCARRPAVGRLAPVRIRAGALGNTRDLLVSPQHRMLLRGWQVGLMFGEAEVLGPALGLVDGIHATRDEGGIAEYHHILFDRHEIVLAEGAETESFHPGAEGMRALDAPARAELLELFPELRDHAGGYGPVARPVLRLFEARALAALLWPAAVPVAA